MNLFIDRLKELGTVVLFVGLTVIAFLIVVVLPIKIPQMISLTLTQWVLGALIVAFTLYWVWRFVDWLFIEPFFKSR